MPSFLSHGPAHSPTYICFCYLKLVDVSVFLLTEMFKWNISLCLWTALFQVNLGIYVQDDRTELSVLVDRSVGGTSLVDGQIELMLHRFVNSFIPFYQYCLLSFFSARIHLYINNCLCISIANILICFIGGWFRMMWEVLVRY